jgi:hypothetical protein
MAKINSFKTVGNFENHFIYYLFIFEMSIFGEASLKLGVK